MVRGLDAGAAAAWAIGRALYRAARPAPPAMIIPVMRGDRVVHFTFDHRDYIRAMAAIRAAEARRPVTLPIPGPGARRS